MLSVRSAAYLQVYVADLIYLDNFAVARAEYADRILFSRLFNRHLHTNNGYISCDSVVDFLFYGLLFLVRQRAREVEVESQSFGSNIAALLLNILVAKHFLKTCKQQMRSRMQVRCHLAAVCKSAFELLLCALLRFLDMFLLSEFVSLNIYAEAFFLAYLHCHLYWEAVSIVKSTRRRAVERIALDELQYLIKLFDTVFQGL